MPRPRPPFRPALDVPTPKRWKWGPGQVRGEVPCDCDECMGYDESDPTYWVDHRRTPLHVKASTELAKYAYPNGHTLTFNDKPYTIAQQLSPTGDASVYLVTEGDSPRNDSPRRYALKIFDPRTSLDRAMVGIFFRLKGKSGKEVTPGRVLDWSSEGEEWANKWRTSSKAREFREWIDEHGCMWRSYFGKEEQRRRGPTDMSLQASGREANVRHLERFEKKLVEEMQELNKTEWGANVTEGAWTVEADLQDDSEHSFRTELLAYRRLEEYQGIRIPRLYEHGQVEFHEDNQRSYKPWALLMEYIDGALPISKLPPSKPSNEVKESLEQAIRAIAEWATVFGVVHNDFEADNLLLSGDGKRVVVVDFSQALIAGKPDRVYDDKGVLRPLAGKLFPDEFDEELVVNEESEDEDEEGSEDQDQDGENSEGENEGDEDENEGEGEDGEHQDEDDSGSDDEEDESSPAPDPVFDAHPTITRQIYRRDSAIFEVYGPPASSTQPNHWAKLLAELKDLSRNQRVSPLDNTSTKAERGFLFVKAEIDASLRSCARLRRKKARARRHRRRSRRAYWWRWSTIEGLFRVLEAYEEDERLRQWYTAEFDRLKQGEAPRELSMLEASRVMPASVPYIALDAIRALAQDGAPPSTSSDPDEEDGEDETPSQNDWARACWSMWYEAGLWSALHSTWGIRPSLVAQWLAGLPEPPEPYVDGICSSKDFKQWRPFNALLDFWARQERIRFQPQAEDAFLWRVREFERARAGRVG